MQQQNFQQIADCLGVADDVVANSIRAKTLAHDPGGGEDGQLTICVGRVADTVHLQRAGIAQQAHQQAALGGFVQARIIGLDTGCGQKFGYHLFVFVRALAQVYCRQMKTKNFDRTYQGVQPLCHQGRAMVGLQRSFNGAQFGREILGAGVGVLRCDGVACRLCTCKRVQGRGQARVHASQCTAVGLVHAVNILVRRTLRQGLHVGRAIVKHGGYRQLTTQVMHFGQVMAQRHFGLAAQRVIQRLGADVGVAIAVATNPLAHAQKAVHRLVVAQQLLQVGIQFGYLAQKGGFVITQCVFYFIGHGELVKA